MSEQINDDESAYPVVTKNGIHEYGLSKREAFAMAALTGILANPHSDRRITFERIGEDAVVFADAILTALFSALTTEDDQP